MVWYWGAGGVVFGVNLMPDKNRHSTNGKKEGIPEFSFV